MKRRVYSVRRAIALGSIAVFALIVGCSVNPATGKRQFTLIGQSSEIEIGKENDQQIVQHMGLYEDPQLEALVSTVGKRLAARSERTDLPWTFRIVDDPVINAFALPGGYIYMTRGILAHFNSEAELASVMGHEIGHVTARHGVSQMSKQQLLGGLYGIGMIFSEEVRQFGDVIETSLGLMFLKFSRDDERQADDLGLRYVQRVGYDPRPMADMFDTLRRVSEAGDAGRVPGWMSTHPAPENRRDRINGQIGPNASGTLNRDSYIALLDGLIYGADPRQGYFKEHVFFHPEMRFNFDFPASWKTVNQRTAVVGGPESREAVIRITLAAEQTAQAAADEFFKQDGVTPARAWKSSINGLTAVSRAFQATSGESSLRGLVAFVEHDNRVFRLLGMTPAAKWATHTEAIQDSLGSFRELTDRAALSVQPARVKIVRASSSMSLEQLAGRYDSSQPAETLALLNGLEPDARVEAGRPVKVVVGGELP